MKNLQTILILIFVFSCTERSNFRYYNLACSSEEIGDYKNAIKHLDKALEINPNDLDALNNRGWDKYDIGDTLGALKDFETMIKLDSTCDKGFHNRGQIFIYKKQYYKALLDFNKVLKLKGGGPVFLVNIDNALIGRKEKPVTSLGDLFYYKGVANYYTKNLNDAFNDFSYCIESGNNVADSYYMRAFIYFNKGMKEKACEDFQKAVLFGIKISNDEYKKFCR